jgi:hypothetical protein
MSKAKGPNLDHITEALRPLAVPLASLSPDPDNARRHDEANIRTICASLEEYGQRKPLVVKKDGMVIKAGNGTVEAAKRLGWTHLAAVIVDEDDAHASGYALADNRTGELSFWDEEQLAKNLTALLDEGVPQESLGWEPEELERLLETVDVPDPSPAPLPTTPDPAPPPAPVDVTGAQPHLRVPLVFFIETERIEEMRKLFRHPTLETEMNADLLLEMVDMWQARNTGPEDG